jgi:hypothetical protein
MVSLPWRRWGRMGGRRPRGAITAPRDTRTTPALGSATLLDLDAFHDSEQDAAEIASLVGNVSQELNEDE